MNNTSLVLSNRRVRLISWTLLSMIPIIGMAVDLIAPSLPAITSGLHSTSSIVKNAISLYLIGYGLGNFTSGILTDAAGRKKLLIGGLCGFILVSLIAATTLHIEVLLATRFVQGLMLGTLAVMTRAILADILPKEKLVASGVMIGMMWGIGPVIGPVIGGYLEMYFGWQAGFYFFSILGILGLILTILIIPETCASTRPLNLSILKQNFGDILTHHQFIALSILMGLNYSLMIIFHTAGPFLIQNILHYSAVQFGNIALGLGAMFVLATIICRYLLTKYEAKQLLSIAIKVSSIIAILAVIAGYSFNHDIVFVTIISGIMFFVTGVVFPLSMGKGMSLFSHIAGSASATMYLISTIITSTSSALLSFVPMQTDIPLMWIYLFLTCTSTLVYFVLINRAKLA